MPEPKARPTPREMILWAIPTLCALAFTLLALLLHRGVEWGLGAILFGLLYFIIRYGGRTIETPDQ